MLDGAGRHTCCWHIVYPEEVVESAKECIVELNGQLAREHLNVDSSKMTIMTRPPGGTARVTATATATAPNQSGRISFLS